MITADLHTHSSFSTDSHAPLEAMVQEAIQRGLKLYCVTEHNDYGHHIYSNRHEKGYEYGDMSREEVDALFVCDAKSFAAELLRLKKKYRDEIDLRLGMELGLQPQLAGYFDEFSKSLPFDLLIGSCHEAGGRDPYFPGFMEGRTAVDAYRFYFGELLLCAKNCSDSYDTIAHPDYGLRYHHPEDFVFDYNDYEDVLDDLLSFLIDSKKALELNTGSLSYFRADNLPIVYILRRYHELGGRLITVGSDAHEPSAIARHFDRAHSILLDLGFDRYAVYRERKPTLLPL